MRKLALVILLLPPAAGCGSGRTPAAATNVVTHAGGPGTPAGFSIRSVPDQGFSVALPKGWRSIDSREALRAAGTEFAKENPRVAGELQVLQRPNSPMKFLAVDPHLHDAFATNLNVLAARIPSALSYSTWTQAQITDIQRVRPKGLRQETLQLPAGQTFHLTYRATFRTGTRMLTASINQFMVKRGAILYVLTYTTTPSAQRLYARIFDESARSFRLSG